MLTVNRQMDSRLRGNDKVVLIKVTPLAARPLLSSAECPKNRTLPHSQGDACTALLLLRQ